MLEVVAALGGGLFILASLVVGARLMLLSRRTRGVPELVLGAALFLMGGVGYPLMAAAVQATQLADGVRVGMLAGQMLTTVAGMAGIAWFTRRVFRPKEAWATALFIALMAAYAGLIGIQVFGNGLLAFANDPENNPWRLSNYMAIVVMSWAGGESIYYWTLQRRRLALGLADPVVADRFKLWGVAILTADSISLVSMMLEWAGISMIGTPISALVVGSLGLVAAGSLWMAFLPTAGYLERVRQRSTA